MSHIIHRQVGKTPPMAVSGDGPYVIDADGRRYFDACGGAAVSCLGHSDKDVIAAVKAQMDTLPFAHTGFFTSAPAEALGEYLVANAPDGIDWVYFTSGGSEAVETAIKMARHYYLEIGQPKRTKFVARRQSYHGNTLGALALGGHKGRRAAFEPLLMDVAHVSPCYAYREKTPGETDDAYAQRLADELEATLLALGPETVCAFVAETVSGASLGGVAPVADYFKRVRAVCDRYGVLLILDEIMSGMGRTGTLFACEQDGVVPDMITIAKGLGAGYQPIGAVMVSKNIFQALDQGSEFINGHTYMGHPTACAGALAVQHAIRDRDLLHNVRVRGGELTQALQARFADNPHVGDIRGRGLFLGVELVADKDSKAPFDPALKLYAKVKAQAMKAGLMCYPGSGSDNGVAGDHILLAPPFIIDNSHVSIITDLLATAVDAALLDIGA